MYGAAAAWLPNPEKATYYLDLPFSYDKDNQPVLDNFQMERWNANSLLSLVDSHEKELIKLKSIYIDCGINDELNMYLPNLALHKQLNEMNIKHVFELHEGTHFNHLYQRLEKSFVYLSNEFPKGI